MAANISATVSSWTTIAASNQPDTTDPAASLCDDFHAILAAVRREHTYNATEVTLLAAGTFIPTARFNVLTYDANSTVVQMVGAEGQERSIVVASSKSPLFQHSAKLVMPGSTDLQCTAGDVVSFIFESASTARCASFVMKENTTPRAFTLNSLNEHWGTTATTEIDDTDFTVATEAFNCHLSVTTSVATAMTIVIPATTSLGNRPRRIYFRGNNRQSPGVFLIRGASGEAAYYDNAGCDLTTYSGGSTVTGIAYKGGTSCFGIIEFIYDAPRMGLPTTSVVVTRGSCLTLGS